MIMQETLTFQTKGRGTQDITQQVAEAAAKAGIQTGLVHVFVQHTSASVMLCENGDPDVRLDIEDYFQRSVPDADPRYRHCNEGATDMSGHIRTILTKPELTVPVSHGRLALGTWQSIYLYEHRAKSLTRRVVLTVMGD